MIGKKSLDSDKIIIKKEQLCNDLVLLTGFYRRMYIMTLPIPIILPFTICRIQSRTSKFGFSRTVAK